MNDAPTCSKLVNDVTACSTSTYEQGYYLPWYLQTRLLLLLVHILIDNLCIVFFCNYE